MTTQVHFSPETALIVVDVQHDFAHPNGNLFVPGAIDAIPNIVALINAAKAAGAPVIYTADRHPEETPHFDQWPVHCVAGTPGAELMPQLPPSDYPVIAKGTGGEDGYSAFTVRNPVTGEESTTALDSVLQLTQAKQLVIIGIATDVCVRATVLDALDRNWPVTVVANACAGVDPQNSEAALKSFADAGVHVV